MLIIFLNPFFLLSIVKNLLVLPYDTSNIYFLVLSKLFNSISICESLIKLRRLEFNALFNELCVCSSVCPFFNGKLNESIIFFVSLCFELMLF